MKTNSKVAATIIAAALATTSISGIAQAATDVTTKTDVAGQTETQHIRVPATGKHVLEGVRAARLALFDGNLDLAKERVALSHHEIKKHAAKFAVKLEDGKGFGLPVDTGLQFAEGFEPKEAHGPAISEAGAILQEGRIDEAINVMSNAGVELDIAVVMLPVQSTTASLEQALTDIKEGHIHKANMALKSIETSIEVQDYKPDALPAQGYPETEVLPS